MAAPQRYGKQLKSMAERMTAEQQARLAEWLDKSRRCPAPLTDWVGPPPIEEYTLARNCGLFGLGEAEFMRIGEEIRARMRPAPRAGSHD